MPKRRASRRPRGSAFKRRRPAYRRKRFMNRNISRIARAVVLRASERKMKQLSWGKTELFHNSVNPTVLGVYHGNMVHLNAYNKMPSKGDDEDQRNGDQVIMRGWKIRMLLGAKADRPNITYRIIVVACRLGLTNYSSLFDNTTGNALLDPVNTNQNTILFQKYYKPNKGMVSSTVTGAREYTVPFRLWLPRKKIYKFSLDGTVLSDSNIYVAVIAYDAYGTVATDNIGYYQWWTEQIYKDP